MTIEEIERAWDLLAIFHPQDRDELILKAAKKFFPRLLNVAKACDAYRKDAFVHIPPEHGLLGHWNNMNEALKELEK